METQTYLSRHYKFISVLSDDFLHAFLEAAEEINNSHTSSTHRDLYDIPHIFYQRIIHTHCLWTLTGYYIYIYIYIYPTPPHEKDATPGQFFSRV